MPRSSADNARASGQAQASALRESLTFRRRKIKAGARLCLGALGSVLFTLSAKAADPADPPAPANPGTNRVATLMSLNLDDLLHGEVTTVSKRPEDMFNASAAIFVITSEDIRRAGALNFPDALRMAPGVDVAQIEGSQWAVSVRGFSGPAADKLLVLVDGRSVYSPNQSGVDWRHVDYPLEDVERIEVVRGPGGTLWGANAVNGVINIITKSAADTQGLFMTAGSGNHDLGFGTVRYGEKIGENGFVRVYVDEKDVANNYQNRDGYNFTQGGFRSDWTWESSRLTFQGDFYHGNYEQLTVIPQYTPVPGVVPALYLPVVDERFSDTGGNVLLRFDHQFSSESDLQLQAYYDRTATTETFYAGSRNIFDVDFQHRLALPGRQELLYGLGYRYLPDNFNNPNPTFITWNPTQRNPQLFSSFIQDEITLVEDHLRLIGGTKLEHNDVTGWEIEPTGRLVWQINPKQTAWTAVSRAVQVPGRNIPDVQTILLPVAPMTVPVGPPFGTLPLFVTGTGNPNVSTTEVLTYELGYRIQPAEKLSFDATAFYNIYHNLLEGAVTGPFFNPNPYPHLDEVAQAAFGGSGVSYGFELAAQWLPADWWRLQANYSLFHLDLQNVSQQSIIGAGRDPQQQVSLRSSMDLPGHLQLDFTGKWVDSLPSFAAEGITSYFDLGARLGWKPTKNLEFAVVGQNLISPRRLEFGADNSYEKLIAPVGRAVYFQISGRF